MPTRLRRPAFWRPLAVAVALVAFQGYLGFNVVSGQFGIESQRQMHEEITELRAQSAALQAQISAYRHRVGLFDPARLDPDILSERARALLAMARPDDVVVMVDPISGEPIMSSFPELTESQLTGIISGTSDI